MKKIFLLFLALAAAISLPSCEMAAKAPQAENTSAFEETSRANSKKLEVKSVWITYYELQGLLENKSAREFENTVNEKFRELFDMGFNTVTVHVRPFADAFYRSRYFPPSRYCFGELAKTGEEMPFDPLEIMCAAARKNKLRLEAWVNPYRVSSNGDASALPHGSPAGKWLKSKKKKSSVYVSKSGIYFNPASERVTELIVSGVREIVEGYDIAAVHFDDYFYPTASKDIDKKEYKKYLKSGGEMSLGDFRRECVSNMVKSVYSAIKKADENVLFVISPASDTEKNYNELFADTKRWASEDGFADYVCPQIYFGFKNARQPFMLTAKKWSLVSKRGLYAGLALYKAGRKDEYAASDDEDAINEFETGSDIIARQIDYISRLDNARGVYIFSYGFLFDEKCKKETENMAAALKNH